MTTRCFVAVVFRHQFSGARSAYVLELFLLDARQKNSHIPSKVFRVTVGQNWRSNSCLCVCVCVCVCVHACAVYHTCDSGHEQRHVLGGGRDGEVAPLVVRVDDEHGEGATHRADEVRHLREVVPHCGKNTGEAFSKILRNLFAAIRIYLFSGRLESPHIFFQFKALEMKMSEPSSGPLDTLSPNVEPQVQVLQPRFSSFFKSGVRTLIVRSRRSTMW